MIDVSFQAAARLAARSGNPFKLNGTLADLESMQAVPKLLPACFVMPLSEQATQNDVIAGSVQLHEATFAVVVCTRWAGNATGDRAVDLMTPLREFVQAGLVGWMPTGCNSPVSFAQGTLVEAEAGATVWRDVFTVQRRYQRPFVTA